MDKQQLLDPVDRERQSLLAIVTRCEWAGVACLFALAALIFGGASYERSIDLQQLIGLPRGLQDLACGIFLASWLLAGIGLLLRSCELGLESKARDAGQKAALRKVNSFRRKCLAGIVAAFVLISVVFDVLVALLPLAGAACLLHRELGEMSRRILS